MKKDKYGSHPSTQSEFLEYVQSELKRGTRGYNESAEALSNIAVAAFNYTAHVLGNSGAQAGWAGLVFLEKTRGYDLPFGIINSEHLLYPQYDLRRQLEEWIKEWSPTIQKAAKKRLSELTIGDKAHPDVLERWKYLANGGRP